MTICSVLWKLVTDCPPSSRFNALQWSNGYKRPRNHRCTEHYLWIASYQAIFVIDNVLYRAMLQDRSYTDKIAPTRVTPSCSGLQDCDGDWTARPVGGYQNLGAYPYLLLATLVTLVRSRRSFSPSK
jgi:hypothetical protein